MAPDGLLNPLPMRGRRFGRWFIDCMTNLPLCNGSNAMLSCIEGVLGYMRLMPCFMGEGELFTEQVAHLFFKHVVRTFGLPDELLHDRDPRFTADFWQHLWDKLGLHAVFSSAYHSQTDGKAERAHSTIEQAIRCMLNEHSLPPDDLCKALGTLELGLNSAYADSTGKSQARGAFGELPRLPVDVLVGAG